MYADPVRLSVTGPDKLPLSVVLLKRLFVVTPNALTLIKQWEEWCFPSFMIR